MRKKLLLSLIILITFLGFSHIISAQSLGTLDQPPRLRDLEPVLVQVIYVIWALTGIIFALILMFIGFQYMTSLGDQQKQQELMQRGRNWLIGLFLVFLGYPLVVTIYGVIGVGENNPDCYQQVSTPGFHFFFPDVCTDPQANSNKYAIASSCKNFTQEETVLLQSQNKICHPFYGVVMEEGKTYEVVDLGTDGCVKIENMASINLDPDQCDPDYYVAYKENLVSDNLSNIVNGTSQDTFETGSDCSYFSAKTLANLPSDLCCYKPLHEFLPAGDSSCVQRDVHAAAGLQPQKYRANRLNDGSCQLVADSSCQNPEKY